MNVSKPNEVVIIDDLTVLRVKLSRNDVTKYFAKQQEQKQQQTPQKSNNKFGGKHMMKIRGAGESIDFKKNDNQNDAKRLKPMDPEENASKSENVQQTKHDHEKNQQQTSSGSKMAGKRSIESEDVTNPKGGKEHTKRLKIIENSENSRMQLNNGKDDKNAHNLNIRKFEVKIERLTAEKIKRFINVQKNESISNVIDVTDETTTSSDDANSDIVMIDSSSDKRKQDKKDSNETSMNGDSKPKEMIDGLSPKPSGSKTTGEKVTRAKRNSNLNAIIKRTRQQTKSLRPQFVINYKKR